MTVSRKRYALGVLAWEVWRLPRALLFAVLSVEVAAILLCLASLLQTSAREFLVHGVAAISLLFGGIIYTEAARRAERSLVGVAARNHINLTSVWTFSAALLFPPALACMVVIALDLFRYTRVSRPVRRPPHRVVFTTATVVLAVHAAALIASGGSGEHGIGGLEPLTVIVSMLAYTAVNMLLVVGAVRLSSNKDVREILAHGDNVVLEIAALTSGALLVLGVTHAGPAVTALALPPLVVLHRAILVRQLERAANTDNKTGLLAAAAWQQRAMQELARIRRNAGSAAILILDLDHFKKINDQHGHLAGDAVLAAVGTVLREEVGADDIAGRFGGEEFVIMLPRPEAAEFPTSELRDVAERIRERIRQLAVAVRVTGGTRTVSAPTVSIGGATSPRCGPELHDLVAAADRALYAGKRSGRDQVRIGQRRVDRPGSDPDPRSERPD
jgi:diguanylate cyclase (GGDEF)-like protein